MWYWRKWWWHSSNISRNRANKSISRYICTMNSGLVGYYSTYKGEGSQWVICSISKLLELAGGKCQVANCGLTRQVSYEVTGCYLQLSGVCQDDHWFKWSSSEFHTNKIPPRFLTSIYYWHPQLLRLETALLKWRCFATSCTWLSFRKQHFTPIKIASSALQWILFMYKSRYVCIILYLACIWYLCCYYSQNLLKNTRWRIWCYVVMVGVTLLERVPNSLMKSE